jgi:hypothetical protein
MKETFPKAGEKNNLAELGAALREVGCRFTIHLRSRRPANPQPKAKGKGKGKVKGKGAKFGRPGGGYRLSLFGPAGETQSTNKPHITHTTYAF